MSWEGDVINKNGNRLEVELKTKAVRTGLGLLWGATGGLLGKQPEGQQPVADRNGVLPRAASAGTDASRQANESLRRFGQQHGIGVPEQTGQTGLGKFLGDIGDAFSRRILPSDGMINRLKNGAAAATVAASGVVAGGVALAQDGANAVSKAVSKPTADEIAQKVAKGELDGHKAQEMINAGQVQLPDASTIKHQKPAPIEDRSFRAAAVAVTEPATAEPPVVTKGITSPNIEVKVIPPTTVPSTPAIVAPQITEQFTAAAKETFIDMRDNKNALRIDADTHARARAFVSKPAEPGGMN